jgi:hypothetical protein
MATIAAMTALSVAAFGLQTWSAFQQSLVITRRFVLEQGDTGWEKIQSVFSAARMLGGTVSEAYVLQAAVSALVVGAVAWLWHSRADVRLKCVSLLCAGLLATPYSLDYDMVLLGPAIAFVAAYGLEKGFAPFEKTLLAAVWVTPLLARLVAKLSHIPVGAIAMLTLFAFTILRSRSEALSHDREVLAPARTRST